MKVGIALGSGDRERAKEALELALAHHREGAAVELFLVYGGVEVYDLASSDETINRLLVDAHDAGILSACGACAFAHGMIGTITCKRKKYWHLWRLRRTCDTFHMIR